MKNIIKKSIIRVAASVCTSMASSVSASACMWGCYQPKEPKCLSK